MVQLVGTTSLGLGKLIDGKNQFVHIRYSAHSNGSNMTTEIQADTKYIGIATNSSETAPTSPSDYSWGRFVGTPGVSSYTWIRYSSNADGSNMTAIPNEETKYIGVAVTAEDSAPTDYTRYSWALFKGSDGRGVKKTEVSYQKSTSGTVIPTDAWLASIPSLSEGEYLWTRTLFTYTDGTTTSTYNVSRNGTSGLGIARTDVHYQKSTSGAVAPTGTWTVTIPTVRANEYLWTRTTITYTDDSTSVSYSVGKMGADGKDAQLLYLTASSQIQAFDKDDRPKTTQPITISAKLQNASGTATFVAIPYVGNTAQTPITLGGTGNDRTLLPSQWTDPKWTIIAITAILGSLTDTISVNKVKDGESGETPVVHLAWADSADGSEGFTLELPTNKIPKYRGYYVDYSTEASTNPKVYKWERNPDDAAKVADEAKDKADAADSKADSAIDTANSAKDTADEASKQTALVNGLANAAKELADKANADAAEANRLLGIANTEISKLNTNVNNVRSDLSSAETELNSKIETVKTTLTQDYATKTNLSETQITLNKTISNSVASVKQEMSEKYAVKSDLTTLQGEYNSFKEETAKKISQQVSSIETVQTNTTEAQKLANDAFSKANSAVASATNASSTANSALDKATDASSVANSASQNASNAVASANSAVSTANTAKNNADKAIADVASLTKTVNSQSTRIDQTSSRIDQVASGVTEVGNKLDNLQVGSRNLALNSGREVMNRDYRLSAYYISPSEGGPLPNGYGYLVDGKKYTIVICLTTDSTINEIRPFLSLGFQGLGFISLEKNKKQVVSLDFTARYYGGRYPSDSPEYAKLEIYRYPNPYEIIGAEYVAVHWVKIVDASGVVVKDWGPAPEDQQSQIDGINNNLSNNYYQKTTVDSKLSTAVSGITAQYTKDINTRLGNYYDKSTIDSKLTIDGQGIATYVKNTQSKLDNLQVGGRNILRGTKDMKLGSGKWVDGTWRKSGSGTIKNVTLTDFPLPYITSGIEITSTTGECGIAQDKLKLESGYYTLSYYVKAKTANTKILMQAFWNGSYHANKTYILKDTNWTRISVTGELKESQDSINAGYIYVQTPNSTITVAAPFEHRSNKEGEWSPAPEDMATADQAQQAQNDANQANSKADATEQRVSVAESTIKQLSDSISMLVTDSNGSSMMTQTSDGWTFNIDAITSAIDSATNNIDNLSDSLSQTNNVVNNLNNLANDLTKKTAYINMTTDETGAPCIELGKTGNAFKVRITNTSVDFIQGSSKIAYVSNQALFIEKAIIKSELQIGETKGFIWKTRSNGNMGLRWFG